MISAKRWIEWRKPLGAHCKRSLLLAVLALFSTAHLLATSPPEERFADASLTSASCPSTAGAHLDATIESSESPVSVDVVLRDASCSSGKLRYSSAEQMNGSRRFTEPGTTGPPSILNNTSAAA